MTIPLKNRPIFLNSFPIISIIIIISEQARTASTEKRLAQRGQASLLMRYTPLLAVFFMSQGQDRYSTLERIRLIAGVGDDMIIFLPPCASNRYAERARELDYIPFVVRTEQEARAILFKIDWITQVLTQPRSLLPIPTELVKLVLSQS